MIKDPELLKLAVKAIEAEPKRWDQGAWAMGRPQSVEPIKRDEDGYQILPLQHAFCGTTMCLAGHVVHQAGYQIVLSIDEVEQDDLDYNPHHVVGAHSCVDDTGKEFPIERKATELLGLTEEQADDLFGCMSRNLPEFKRVITEVTGVEFE
jgi:hypothetical protein